VGAQEGVGRPIVAEEEGHRGAVLGSQLGHAALALGERRVQRVGVEGEAQVRLGVLVPAVDQGVVGQLAERGRERLVHLGRRAFEEAPAAGGEEGVAGEHVGGAGLVGHDERDGAERVPGNVQNPHLEAERLEARARGHELGRAVDALAIALVGHDGHAFDGALELGDAPHVIEVVVGRPDADEPQAFALERRQHGGRLGRVDHDGLADARALDQVGVVVTQAGNRQNTHGEGTLSVPLA
jgi:hypothetical protein